MFLYRFIVILSDFGSKEVKMSSLKYESENTTVVKLSKIQNKSRFANARICRPFTNHLANPVRTKEIHNKKNTYDKV